MLIDNLRVCVDCAMLIANGDARSGMDSATEARCRAGIAKESTVGGIWFLSGEDSEYAFSWRECDCCASRLGGARREAAVLYPASD
jgi:hypothetical protein